MKNPNKNPNKSASRSPNKTPGKPDTRLYLYGLHAVRAAVANPRRKIINILTALPSDHANRKALEEELEEHPNPPRLSETAPGHLDKLVGQGAVHQGIVAAVKPLPNYDVREFLQGFVPDLPHVALLDQVTDPHNVGAILRSAAAFGIGGLITPARHSPQETGLIARISSGGLEVVPWLRVRNLGQACETLHELGYTLSGFAGEADKEVGPATFDASSPQALVFGSEGEGMRQKTRELCHRLLKLPTQPPVVDLNVSNAAAVSFYALRQAY